jgi:hypothetical protein
MRLQNQTIGQRLCFEKQIKIKRIHLPGLSQFPGSGIELRNESGAVADSHGVRVGRMSAEAPDQSGRTDADLQIGHNLK